MFLRDDPRMNYRGLLNWPPKWVRRRGAGEIAPPRGEIGVLKNLLLSRVERHPRIYLIIEHENQEYIGCLLFLDSTFRDRIFQVLGKQVGNPIASISKVDASFI